MKRKLLIVDDATSNIEILCEILQDDYNIIIATNGHKAITLAKTQIPDLILLDIVMPELNGFDVCNQLKNSNITQKIPIIFLTAKNDVKDIVKGFDIGAVDYVTKPFNAAELLARIQTQMALKTSHEELLAAQQRELGIAYDIQMGMLPKPYYHGGHNNNIEISALLKPAKAVGGDLYDYFFCGKYLYFVIGDVADKGIPAALFMMRTNTLFKTIANSLDSPENILNKMNDELCQDNDTCMFVTLICGILNTESGQLQLANAGHNLPLLLSNQDTHFLEFEAGPPLGYRQQSQFPIYHHQLQSKEILFLYTDGITEAFNEQQEMFTDERLLQLLSGNTHSSAKAVTAMVFQQIQKFSALTGVQSDDITIFSLSYQ